jgi:hypothetical protein
MRPEVGDAIVNFMTDSQFNLENALVSPFVPESLVQTH